MMKRFLILIITGVVLISASYAQAEDNRISYDKLIVEHQELQKEYRQLQNKLSELELKTAELKKERNQQIDEFRKREVSMLTLASLLTLVSLFMILFGVMYLSIRRRRRVEFEEYSAQIKKLKS